MQEQEIFDHIEAGRHQELYHEWAKSGTWSVRYKLARKGYELDTLRVCNRCAIVYIFLSNW